MEDDNMSTLKLAMSIFRKQRVVFVTDAGRLLIRMERVEIIARWSDKPGSAKVTEETRLEDSRVIRRSRVWPAE
jgi:hypothetical protein